MITSRRGKFSLGHPYPDTSQIFNTFGSGSAWRGSDRMATGHRNQILPPATRRSDYLSRSQTRSSQATWARNGQTVDVPKQRLLFQTASDNAEYHSGRLVRMSGRKPHAGVGHHRESRHRSMDGNPTYRPECTSLIYLCLNRGCGTGSSIYEGS